MPQSIRTYPSHGPATSKEIQAANGLSQSAVSRAIRELGDSVVKLHNGRSPRYALTRNAFGGDDRLPLSVVDMQGNADLIAHVRPLAHGGFCVEPTGEISPLLLGESGSGSYADLPYFLLDLTPQGFIGHKIAEELARQTDDFPNDPRRWNTNHICRHLISNGDDLPGNFKFGEQTLLRMKHKPTAVPDERYLELANSVLSGTIPESLAAEEQPKHALATATAGSF
jgi:hypothetical protein